MQHNVHIAEIVLRYDARTMATILCASSTSKRLNYPNSYAFYLTLNFSYLVNLDVSHLMWFFQKVSWCWVVFSVLKKLQQRVFSMEQTGAGAVIVIRNLDSRFSQLASSSNRAMRLTRQSSLEKTQFLPLQRSRSHRKAPYWRKVSHYRPMEPANTTKRVIDGSGSLVVVSATHVTCATKNKKAMKWNMPHEWFVASAQRNSPTHSNHAAAVKHRLRSHAQRTGKEAKDVGTRCPWVEMITKNTVSWERQHHERLRSVLKERAKDTRGSEHILDASCQGHPTGRFGEYLFGRPKIAWDIRIQLQWKLEISLAKHYQGLS